jgi:hypothetical protein
MEKPENYIEETKSKLNTEMRSNTLQFIVIILGLIWLVKSIIITIFDISKGIEDKSLSYSFLGVVVIGGYLKVKDYFGNKKNKPKIQNTKPCKKCGKK